MTSPRDLAFFLGGHDLEMEVIAQLLDRHARNRTHDRHLRWGGKASAYAREIAKEKQKGRTLVLVELDDDIGLPESSIIVVDHHGDRAGGDAPTSLHQVFRLLERPAAEWTREMELTAANDRAWIPGLEAAGATPVEIRRIRDRDRAAQGITKSEAEEARRAVAKAWVSDQGLLTVVELPHSRAAVVTDYLHPVYEGPGYRNLLVLSPDEANFYGDGDIVGKLRTRFAASWTGGDLPRRGFWGCLFEGAPPPELRDRILRDIEADSVRASEEKS